MMAGASSNNLDANASRAAKLGDNDVRAATSLIDVSKISGLGDFTSSKEKLNDKDIVVFRKKVEEQIFGGEECVEKPFLVVRGNTIEVRSDRKLSRILREKYESVMESRYFGRGGLEIVTSGQLSQSELEDLIRLSYNLTTGETAVITR